MSMGHLMKVAPRRFRPQKSAQAKRAGRRERRSAEIRERLYGAALRLFAERGYLQTKVEDITEAADVGKGTFFNYFPTKEHVLAAFGGQRVSAVARALDRARQSGSPVLPLVGELAQELGGLSSRSPALLCSIYVAHASCEPARRQLQERMEEGRRMLGEILLIGQKRGEVRGDLAPGALGRQIQMIFMGVMLAWSLSPSGSLRKAMADMWQIVAPSLRASASRAAHGH